MEGGDGRETAVFVFLRYQSGSRRGKRKLLRALPLLQRPSPRRRGRRCALKRSTAARCPQSSCPAQTFPLSQDISRYSLPELYGKTAIIKSCLQLILKMRRK